MQTSILKLLNLTRRSLPDTFCSTLDQKEILELGNANPTFGYAFNLSIYGIAVWFEQRTT